MCESSFQSPDEKKVVLLDSAEEFRHQFGNPWCMHELGVGRKVEFTEYFNIVRIVRLNEIIELLAITDSSRSCSLVRSFVRSTTIDFDRYSKRTTIPKVVGEWQAGRLTTNGGGAGGMWERRSTLVGYIYHAHGRVHRITSGYWYNIIIVAGFYIIISMFVCSSFAGSGFLGERELDQGAQATIPSYSQLCVRVGSDGCGKPTTLYLNYCTRTR
eukprot:scaffold2246_cov162-Amphora_coffeaeformis.AAC.5